MCVAKYGRGGGEQSCITTGNVFSPQIRLDLNSGIWLIIITVAGLSGALRPGRSVFRFKVRLRLEVIIAHVYIVP